MQFVPIRLLLRRACFRVLGSRVGNSCHCMIGELLTPLKKVARFLGVAKIVESASFIG